MDNLHNNIPTMLTIKETAQRTKLPVHFVRKLCWEKKVPYLRVGKKYLIPLEKFCDFLNCSQTE